MWRIYLPWQFRSGRVSRYAKRIKDSQAATSSVDELGKDLNMTLQVLVDKAVPQFCYLHSVIS